MVELKYEANIPVTKARQFLIVGIRKIDVHHNMLALAWTHQSTQDA